MLAQIAKTDSLSPSNIWPKSEPVLNKIEPTLKARLRFLDSLSK